MPSDAGDGAGSGPLDVDGSVEPDLERGVYRHEARGGGQAATPVQLFDPDRPDPTLVHHSEEIVATPDVRGERLTHEEPAIVKVEDRIGDQARDDRHASVDRPHDGLRKATEPVLDGGTLGDHRSRHGSDASVGLAGGPRGRRHRAGSAVEDLHDLARYRGSAHVRTVDDFDDHRLGQAHRGVGVAHVLREGEPRTPPDTGDDGDRRCERAVQQCRDGGQAGRQVLDVSRLRRRGEAAHRLVADRRPGAQVPDPRTVVDHPAEEEDPVVHARPAGGGDGVEARGAGPVGHDDDRSHRTSTAVAVTFALPPGRRVLVRALPRCSGILARGGLRLPPARGQDRAAQR